MKKISFSFLFSLLAVVFLFPDNINAQEDSVIKDTLFSEIMNEKRPVNIILPEGYEDEPGRKYEVIYLTDGEWVLNLFPFVYKFALDEDYVPPVIIVDIPNVYPEGANQRDRDFLPVHVPSPAISGGASEFLSFLKNELIPYVDNNYRTNGVNSLYGHSYGGIFVMYAMLTEPGLFYSYYATDTPYGWNDDYMIKLAAEKIGTITDDKILWIAGIESTYKNTGINRMDSLLKEAAPDNIYWKFVTYPNEKHNSVRLKAMYDGIKFSYSGYPTEALVFHPMNGILLKDKPTAIYPDSFSELRYTVDGTEPDKNSPEAYQGFTISGPAKLVIKSFSTTGKYDYTAKGLFELGDVIPSIKKPRNISAGGMKFSYYKGEWGHLPDFNKLKADNTAITDSLFDIDEITGGSSSFAALYDGYLEITEDGYHIFATLAKGATRLFLGDRMIIDNDQLNDEEAIISFVVPLEKGFYPFRLEYLQRDEDSSMQLIYMPPSGENGVSIPGIIQFYRK